VDWTGVPLGEVPDSILARWLKLPGDTVRRRRRLFGIKPVAIRSLVDWNRLPLGKIPDTYVAAITGLSHPTVLNARRRRGLSPAPKEARGEKPTPIPASEFIKPIRAPFPQFSSPPRRLGSIWRVADEAMSFLRMRERTTVDDLLGACGVCRRQDARREAHKFLRKLGWSPRGDDDSWLRPGVAERVVRSPDPEEITDAVLEVVQHGVWTVAKIGKKLRLPSSKVCVALDVLVKEGAVRRLPSTVTSLYVLAADMLDGGTNDHD